MKRRNADTGKMRRPLKRTKITEGMYGNSLLYLRFVMVWATVVMADYMLEFRFEFLWPFWMMLRSVYDSFRYQGLAFSVFFLCIALTSDMICYFFIPLQYIFFAASTYVWVQYVWVTLGEKGICVPTVAICCAVVYVEGALRAARELELCRPLAAHCVGYPAVSLGFGVKAYVGRRLRMRTQRQVRAQNEFYFQLLRDALPESALENQQTCKEERSGSSVGSVGNGTAECAETRPQNGSLRRRCGRENGLGPPPHTHTPPHTHSTEHAHLQFKLEKLEKHLAQQTATREREKSQSNTNTSTHTPPHAHVHTGAGALASTFAHALSNGSAGGAGAPAPAPAPSPRPRHQRPPPRRQRPHTARKTTRDMNIIKVGSAKSSKCEKKEATSTLREERRKHKNRDKDKEKENTDSHKSTEQTKEHIVKEVESTKESVKSNKDNSSYKEKEKEKEREREREREYREKEKEREYREKEKERDKEREREQRTLRECNEELRRARAELALARSGESEARRSLAAAAAAERQRRAEHAQLRQAHLALQQKMATWRGGERVALERRLSEERRARAAAEHQLLRARQAARTPSGECENEWCKSMRSASEAETAALRNELQQARAQVAQLQRDLQQAGDQVRALEARQEENGSPALRLAEAWASLQERAAHLERSLSAETRVKLDLLSALGDAKRQLHIREDTVSRQEKELEELKAQMLAVMPAEYITPLTGGKSRLRMSDGSPLDPNASVYTPKQLISDA
ncbi:Macoilin [Papilio xuthus]|uniref:Macoilin n=1 Tax=Papilio xuthus TaxID=66420 RepID=A0A194QAE8_PAPXU|nr:Macoilin [Papilio xuthus]